MLQRTDQRTAAFHAAQQNGYLPRFEGFEEKCRLYEQEKQVRVLRLNDGDGVFLDRDIQLVKSQCSTYAKKEE